jgi:hypothetical protein
MKESNVVPLKERRKVKNEEIQREVHGIFRGRESAPEDKAIRGIELLGHKLESDLEDQFREVMSSGGPRTYADREVARLLRMLEKSKDVLDRLYETLEVDEALLEAAAPVLAGAPGRES